MKRRFMSFAIAVMALLTNASEPSQTQAQEWINSDGVASISGGYVQTQQDPWPATPNYVDGPARYWDDNITRDKGGLYENSPLDKFIEDMIKGAFLRVEFLNWDFKPPGDVLLGAPTTASLAPERLFDISRNGQFLGRGRVATTSDLKLEHQQAIRGTLGIPVVGGLLEGNIFSFTSGTDHTSITGLGPAQPGNAIGIPTFIVTTVLTNGQVGDEVFAYDSFFATHFKSNFWGSEANFIMDSYDPRAEFQVRPSFGFRYFGLDEEFTQIGVFDGSGTLNVPIVSEIRSHADNHVYAPQIGLRMEYVHRWFTLGVDPKIGVGWNSYESDLNVLRLRALADLPRFTEESGSRLAVTGDLSVYAKLNVSQNFSVNLGYQIIFIDNVVRPHNSIYYNDNGPAQQNIPPGLVTKPDFGLHYFQGINVGGELRF